MHVSIKTSSIDAFSVLKKYCNENDIKFDAVIIGSSCSMSIKEPSKEVLSAVSRFINALKNMVPINASVYTDTAQDAVDINTFNV